MPDRIDRAVFNDLQDAAGADFVVDLVSTFAEEAPVILGELQDAFGAGAAERFRRAAHSLKSNGQTFGAIQLAERARTLELGGLPADAAPLQALADELGRTLAALKELARG